MWYRYQLKRAAREMLSRRYGELFVAALVCTIISNGITMLSQIFSDLASIPVIVSQLLLYGGDAMVGILGILWIAAIAMLLSLAVGIFLANPMEVGSARCFLEATQDRVDFGNLFFGFSCGRYGNVVLVSLVRSLLLFLWSLLLVIPGMVMSYAYGMVPYLLAENPSLTYRQALAFSRDMTQGHKWEMFVLDLSFLGWYLLGAMACGLGVLFVNPYYYATRAELYVALRAIAIDRGILSLEQLESSGR